MLNGSIFANVRKMKLEVDRISASVSVPNLDKWALSADIQFLPKVGYRAGVAEAENAPDAGSH